MPQDECPCCYLPIDITAATHQIKCPCCGELLEVQLIPKLHKVKDTQEKKSRQQKRREELLQALGCK